MAPPVSVAGAGAGMTTGDRKWFGPDTKTSSLDLPVAESCAGSDATAIVRGRVTLAGSVWEEAARAGPLAAELVIGVVKPAPLQ